MDVMNMNQLVEEVKKLKEKGLSDYDIIQQLGMQGYESKQIYEALNMIDTMPKPVFEKEEKKSEISDEKLMEKIEEISETIIDEKWDELIKSLEKLAKWKEYMESRMHDLELKFENLKEEFNKLHSSVIGQIKEYDTHIIEFSTDIKALHQVFKQIIPEFTNSIQELKQAIRELKIRLEK